MKQKPKKQIRTDKKQKSRKLWRKVKVVFDKNNDLENFQFNHWGREKTPGVITKR